MNVKITYFFTITAVSVAFAISNLSAIPKIDLGQLHMPDPPPSGTNFNSIFPVSDAFDGIHDQAANAWQGTPEAGFIRWNVAPFHTTSVDTAIYDKLDITLNIYHGANSGAYNVAPFMRNLNQYRIYVLEDASDGYRKVAEFKNLESTYVQPVGSQPVGITPGESLAISHNNEWINADSHSFAYGQIMHSITFSTTTDLSQIQIFTNSNTSPGTGSFSINEIETFGVAVPEPSTLALLLGIGALLIPIIHKKCKK